MTEFNPIQALEELQAQRNAKRDALEAERIELRSGPDLTVAQHRRRELEAALRLVVTSAMNNTPLNIPFWEALKRYADENQAALVVIPTRYRNPTTPGEYTTRGAGWWWPEQVVPYLVGSALRVHPHLWVMGDVRVQATASHPLSGLEGFGQGASTIFGHPQMAMKTVATPQFELPKLMHTTGSVSVPKYSESKAGAKARFHHYAGALIVEKSADAFHARVLSGDKIGGFYDLDRYYIPSGSDPAERAEALVLGDTHEWWLDPDVRTATYDGPDSLIGVTRPKRIVHHDIVDSYSITHHHRKDPITSFIKWQGQKSSLRQELEDCVRFLNETTPPDTELVIVASNHHEHITRWICEADWRRDPENALIYLELAQMLLRGGQMTDIGARTIDPLAEWMRPLLDPANLRFLRRDDSYRVMGVELCLHGDVGPSGSRGSIRNLSQLGTRVMIGHGHGAGWEKGACQVGTSTRTTLDYSSRGPGAWLNTHGLIYANKKRQLVNIINGRFRGDQP